MDSTRDNKARTNQYYIAQLNSMEIKISELKAQLRSKDFEIDYLSSKCSSLVSPSHYKDLEAQLASALNENNSLKKKFSDLDELQIVKSQLEQALRMKEVFEQKYRELKSKAMLSEKFEQVLEEKEKEIQTLTAELEHAKKSKQVTDEQLWTANNELRIFKDEFIEKHKNLNQGRRRIQTKLNKKEIVRPYSVTNARESPMKVLQETQNRKTSIMQSPKGFHATENKNPRVVSISLENSLLRPFYKC